MILLVEDEAMLRRLNTRTLTDLGYSVVPAGSVEEAQYLLRGLRHVSLVITDLDLPDASGAVLIDYVHRHLPGLPVLLVTGSHDRGRAIAGSGLHQVQLLLKPFEAEQLAGAVQRLLPLLPAA